LLFRSSFNLLGNLQGFFPFPAERESVAAHEIEPVSSAKRARSEHLRQDIAGFKPGDAVALAVERRGVMQYVAFEVE
jgi:hypothetical protein